MFRTRRTRYTATVESAHRIAPHMARVTLGGPGMSAFRCDEPTQWVKLFVTDPLDGQTVGRAYTVRNHPSPEPRIDIDVVLHGKGPAARWAEVASPGQEVSFSGPKGGFSRDPQAEFYLLAGDESAQPAVFTIAESLPPGMHGSVYLEVDGPQAEMEVTWTADLDVVWVHRAAGRPKGEALRDAVLEAPVPHQHVAAWVAGESGAVRDIRRHFTDVIGLDRRGAYAKGYWKLDEADHRDPLASD
ncbi:siderophore-interacting protein [Streptomyces sp. LHD-70]|uniref:siderophore-interacting protein n=1 Tax=Streptomyces sp. LHD-70 TaxID=3072140 RepID=UPI00280E3D4E|nr:siderophore-interacting protein [Streptomyces sp. LHD-70]MDQ8708135.1 siderophore-interacting protein [Streptomyces sp. LHD-70]